MIFPVALISAITLISASLGSEETCHPLEEECETINVQRYFEKCHKKDVQLLRCMTDYSELQKQYSDLQSEDLKQYAQISKCQQSYSDLVRKHWEVQSQLSDEKVKNEQLHSKHLEVENLKALIKQQSEGIDILKDQIRELKEKSELATLTNQFRENIDKLEKIVKNGGIHENNPTKSEVGTGEVPTTPLPNIKIETTPKTETIDFPDPCPRDQEQLRVLREIKLPGLDPFKVVCRSDSSIGSRWLKVLKKMSHSQIFNRTYEDYERGFGDVGTDGSGEFFIGLNRLHRLTSGKRNEVVLYDTLGRSRCDHFIVGDRSDGYKVKSIGNCNGYGAMSPKQDSKFSTFDRDEDGVPDRNLAKEEGFGWWFDPGVSSAPYSPEEFYINMYIRRTD
ncbi:angiopoietin-related protein 3-like [Drosophila bipectinata]|uniref:angiopoietin-related protein 3-like n=1 Tax=Drosophila bipectinata TaxID=42026 RepID=UPI001C8ABEFD|nr:angiopoietin-related protein 3-like [Drosophila bipectinata]